MGKQNLRTRSVFLSYIPCGYESYERAILQRTHLKPWQVVRRDEFFPPLDPNRIVRIPFHLNQRKATFEFMLPFSRELAHLAISLKKIALEQQVEINEPQDEGPSRLQELREPASLTRQRSQT